MFASLRGATAPTALRVAVSPYRAKSIIMPPFGGHVPIAYHNHSFPRPHRLRWMASHWIRGSLLSPMNPVPLPPQGETRSMERKNRESYISCTIPQFPPLVVNAVSQSPECVSCHMAQKGKSRNADFISIARRAIHNPRPEGPSNLRTLRTFGTKSRQPSRPQGVSNSPILCITSLGTHRKFRYQRSNTIYTLRE